MAERNSPSWIGRREEKYNKVTTENIGRIGDGIRTRSVIHARRGIEIWQKELLNMEEFMEDSEEKNDISVQGEKKRK